MCFARGCIQSRNKLTSLSSPKNPQRSQDTPEMNPKNIQSRNSYVQQSFLTKHHVSQSLAKKYHHEAQSFVMTRQKAHRELHWLSKPQVITSHQPGNKYRFLYYFACKIIKRILTVALLYSYI